ncbi:MAG: beta-L-arabinofuranosidase domain-containing protein [bacterium]
MKYFGVLHELPLAACHPQGWLKRYLRTMRDGLTGHLEAAGYPFNTEGWMALGKYGVKGDDWGPYEQNGYWVDGLLRCGHLLGDRRLIRKGVRNIEHVLRTADCDGYLGPQFLKRAASFSRWPHLVFFRGMMAQHAATGDPRIVRALEKHYLNDAPSYAAGRDVCNVEAMLWTYAQTGNPALLARAREAFRGYNASFRQKSSLRDAEVTLYSQGQTSVPGLLSAQRPTEHGVTYCEIGKLGAILYLHTGNKTHLSASINGFRKLDRHAMLIDGVPSSTENVAGRSAIDGHETCVIADYTWAAGYLLMATGSVEYADKIERACFNAGPGAVGSDFKTLQYFSSPNQVIADRTSNHHKLLRGLSYTAYRPNPGTECCPGDVHRIMPNYAARMWMSDGAGGLVAALYGPSTVTRKLGTDSQAVTVVQETDYPFSERIDFRIRTARPITFAFTLRIPGWCRKAQVRVNGQPAACVCTPGTFVTLRREFRHGDRIALALPMELRMTRWPGQGVGIERGPLVFALRVEEDWQVDPTDLRSTPEFPGYNLYAASPWNYALAIRGRNLVEAVEVIQKPVAANPWSIHTAPLELRVPARRVAGWDLVRQKSILASRWFPGGFIDVTIKGDYRFTPPLPPAKGLAKRLSRKVETVTLVPYGCTKMRIAIFPECP